MLVFISFKVINKTTYLLCHMQTVEIRFGFKYFEQRPKPTFENGSSTTNAPEGS